MFVELDTYWDLPTQVIPVSVNFLTIDAVNEKAAYIFRAPKTGDIDRVSVGFRTVTTPGNLDVRLESVSGSTGLPSGNLVSAGASTQVAVLANWANTMKEIVLDNPGAVVRGDVIAVVVSLPGAGNMQIQKRPAAAGIHSSQGTTYSAVFTTAWAMDSNQPCGFVRYTDGDYPYTNDRVPWHTGQNRVMVTGGDPDEVGNRMVLPIGVRVAGMWVGIGTRTAAAEGELCLYDEANTLLQSVPIDLGQVAASSVSCPQLFDTSVELEAGGLYRATLKPTNASGFQVSEGRCLTAAQMAAAPYGPNIHQTHRTAGGAWTDVDDTRTAIGLLVEAVDIPAGGVESAAGYVL